MEQILFNENVNKPADCVLWRKTRKKIVFFSPLFVVKQEESPIALFRKHQETFCNMNELTYAFNLNNEGVEYLKQNRHREAICYFSKSLRQIKQWVENGSPADDTARGKRLIEDNNRSVNDGCARQIAYTISDLKDIECFIYSDALMFSNDSSDELLNDESHTLSSVVLLNIAITYHRSGLRQNNPVFLRKAETMYDMAMTLLSNDDSYRGTALLVRAAAINNLSQLRHYQGDTAFAVEGFRYLGSLLANFGGALQQKCPAPVYKELLLNSLLVECFACKTTAPTA